MTDEAEVAETMADVAKKAGLKNYLWLYFLIVPLAASTASAVAISIAALEGLSSHPQAAQIYALTLTVGFKAILSIAAAYITGLMLSLGSVGLVSLARGNGERVRATSARKVLDHSSDLVRVIIKTGRSQQALVVSAVVYSAFVLLFAYLWFLMDDVSLLWSIIQQIARTPPTTP